MRIHLRFASWRWIPPAGAGGGYRLPTPTQPVCQMAETSAALHFFTPLFHCQRECLSDGRDQQLCIVFAGLCCLSAGRDTASISDKKCDRPRGNVPSAYNAGLPSTFSLHFFTPLFYSTFHCQRSCLSDGRDQQDTHCICSALLSASGKRQGDY